MDATEVIDEVALRQNIGANVQRLRKQQGLSQLALAEMTGVSRQSINRVETATCLPNADLLYSLADALKVPTDALRQVATTR